MGPVLVLSRKYLLIGIATDDYKLNEYKLNWEDLNSLTEPPLRILSCKDEQMTLLTPNPNHLSPLAETTIYTNIAEELAGKEKSG